MPVNETIERIVYEGVDKLSAASQSAAASTKALKETINGVKDVLGLLGVTVGAGAFIRLQLDALHATAALDDMAEATGASVEKLSAIQRVAKVGGRDFEGLTGQLGRMVKGLKENSEEGSKSAAALAQVGLNARDANGRFRDIGQVLIDVANKLGQFRDTGEKVAFIQDVLGKGAERYLPLLKDIAEGTDLQSKVTAKQAEEAEKAEKNINRLKLSMEDARKELVNDFTPAIISYTNRVLAAKEGTKGWYGTIERLLSVSGDQANDPITALDEIDKRLEKLRSLQSTLREPGFVAAFNRMTAPEDLAILGQQIAFAERQKDVLLKLMQRTTFHNTEGMVEDAAGIHPAPDKPRLDYTSPDLGSEKRDRDLIAKQQEENAQEEARIQSEAAAASDKFRAQERESMRKFRALDLQDTDDYYQVGGATLVAANEERNRVLMEQADREEAEAIQRGADLLEAESDSYSMRVAKLREMLGDRETAENDDFQRRLEQLARFSDEELEALGGRQALVEALEAEHMQRIIKIRQDKMEEQKEIVVGSYRAQAAAIFGQLVTMTAGVAQHSRILFEINKVAAIATIAIKTPEAIASAYAFGARFGGPPLGAGMAIVAGLAMAAQAAAALKTQYGGGGSAPSVAGTTPAPAVTPVPASDSGGARTSITIKLVGEEQQFSNAQVRALLEKLADLTEGGARVFVA